MDLHPHIFLFTNGEELRVVGALTADEVLVIDSGLVTAKITDANGNTLRNGLPVLDELNFPVLHKGENEITVSARSNIFGAEDSGQKQMEVIWWQLNQS